MSATTRFLVLILAVVLGGLPASSVAHTETLNHGVSRDLSQFAGDPNVDGITDIQSLAAPECGNRTKLRHLNGSARAFPPGFNYATMNLAEAQAQNYASSGDFCPSDAGQGDDLFYIKSGNDRFYKFRSITNGGSGISVEYDYLGEGLPTPPNSDFDFETYDRWGIFTDTSTGDPSAWSWNFGDSATSSQRHPRRRYASTNANYNACLTASNSGGPDPTPHCENVSILLRPSLTAGTGGTFDLDGDTLADLVVAAGSGCDGGPNHLETMNGAGAALIDTDYRLIDSGDIAGQSFGTTNFCVSQDYLEGFMVRTSSDAVYKVWLADNSGAGMRIERALLKAGPPPPPTSAFTFSSYDLIVQFIDASTGGPSAWSWDFDDGQFSSAPRPRHRYSSAASRTPCLIASNIGGDGDPACQLVVTALVPSVVVPQNGRFDFNQDGIDDLEVLPAAGDCTGLANKLRPLAGTAYRTLSMDYRDVMLADAAGPGFATGDFCVEVDYESPFILRLAEGSVFKAWTAANDASGVRMQFDLLAESIIFADSFE